MTEQINIFVDNKPGRLSRITQILSENDINIRAIVINDREQFGIIKVLQTIQKHTMRLVPVVSPALSSKYWL